MLRNAGNTCTHAEGSVMGSLELLGVHQEVAKFFLICFGGGFSEGTKTTSNWWACLFVSRFSLFKEEPTWHVFQFSLAKSNQTL